MITTLLVTKNNSNVISSTLNSVKGLGPILVADLRSKDDTVNICKKAGATVFNFDLQNNYSDVKNALAMKATTDWVFWLEPGEEVVSGSEYFETLSDNMYRVMVIKGDVLTKQPRIYRKGTALFNRPVFEEVDDVAKRTLPIVIGGEGVQDLKSVMDCLISWKDVNPFDPEPNYYMACHYLITKNYTQFLALAEHYLFQKKTLDASTIMIRYYMFLLLKNKTPEKALKLILECVATYPLMAEFWCALGDLYLSQMKQPDKAYMFYENAIILGSRRLAEDTMPMEISKYDDYPSKMMEGIKQIYISADINATELRGE